MKRLNRITPCLLCSVSIKMTSDVFVRKNYLANLNRPNLLFSFLIIIILRIFEALHFFSFFFQYSSCNNDIR